MIIDFRSVPQRMNEIKNFHQHRNWLTYFGIKPKNICMTAWFRIPLGGLLIAGKMILLGKFFKNSLWRKGRIQFQPIDNKVGQGLRITGGFVVCKGWIPAPSQRAEVWHKSNYLTWKNRARSGPTGKSKKKKLIRMIKFWWLSWNGRTQVPMD